MFLFGLPSSFLVHSVLFIPHWSFLSIWSIWSYSVKLCSYLVHFAPIWLTLCLFGSLRSYLVPSSHIRSYLFHSIIFYPLRSILVHFIVFGPFLCTYIMGNYRFGLRAYILNTNYIYIYIYIYIFI